MTEQTEATEEQPLAPKPPKRRRWRRWALVFALLPLVTVLITVVFVATLPTFVTPEMLREEAQTVGTEMLGADVQIGRIAYHPATGLELFDVVVGPPEGFTRDVFRAKRIAVRYDLSNIAGSRVRVEEVAVDAPHAVIETIGGRRNVEVLVENLTKGAEPKPDEPDEPPKPASGPLSPIDVDVSKVWLGPLVFELYGEGPNVRLDGLTVDAKASLDAKELFASLRVGLEQGDEPNVSADVPGEQPIHADVRLGTDVTYEVRATTTDGLGLVESKLKIATAGTANVKLGDRELPAAMFSARNDVRIDTGADVVVVEPVTVTFQDHPIVSARAELTGIKASLDELLGPVAGHALAMGLGIEKKRPAKLSVKVKELAAPLDELGPFAAVFAPGVRAGGDITITADAAGSPSSFVAGAPDALFAKVELAGVSGAEASAKAAAAGVGGLVTLTRRADGSRYDVKGAIDVAALRQGPQRVNGTHVDLAADVAALTYPLPGVLSATVGVTVASVAAPPAVVDGLTAGVTVLGRDLFDDNRPEDDPIRVTARVAPKRVRVSQPGQKIDVRRVGVDVTAAIDRVLTPARLPITYDVRGRVGRVGMSDGTAVTRTKLRLRGTVGDPRAPTPFDARAKLSVGVAELVAAGANVQDLDVGVDLVASRIAAHRPRKFPGPPPPMLPATVKVGVTVEAPTVTGAHEAIGDYEAALSLDTKVDVDVVRGKAKLTKLDVAWPGVFSMGAAGAASDVYDPRPVVTLDAKVRPVDLAAAIAKLPPGLLASTPKLAASGRVSADLSVDGRVPGPIETIDLTKPPIDVRVGVQLDEVAANSPTQGLDVAGLTGSLEAALGRGRADVNLKGWVGRVAVDREDTKTPGVVQDVSLALDAGLLDGVWALRTSGGAGGVTVDGNPMGLASFELRAKHPPGGGVDLERVHLAVGASEARGIRFDATGRLAKETFGVLRPKLSIDGTVDLDLVRPFVPELAKSKGVVGARFSVDATGGGIVDLEGALELEGVHHAADQIVVEDATGRLPFSQRLVLPPPTLDEGRLAATGMLGDDLEARLEELAARFGRARATLDADDILVDAPRTADHQALRPYRTKRGPQLAIKSISVGTTKLADVLVEASFGAGLFRLDRFEAGLWEGDVFGDAALQLTSDLDVKLRTRGTITNLNIDEPYSIGKGIAPLTDPDDKEKYRASATYDLEFGLRDRTVNGNVDVFRISRDLVDRMLGAIDPAGESDATKALGYSEWIGLRPVGAKIWIAHNLLNVQFDFKRLWLRVHDDTWNPLYFLISTLTIPVRFVTIPTIGGLWVVPTLNGAIRRVSLSNVIGPMIDEMGIERRLLIVRPFVVSGDTAVVTKE